MRNLLFLQLIEEENQFVKRSLELPMNDGKLSKGNWELRLTNHREDIIIFMVLLGAAVRPRSLHRGLGCSIRTEYAPATERMHRGSSCKFWLN